MKVFSLRMVLVRGRKIGYNLVLTINKNRLPADQRYLLSNSTNMQRQLKKPIVFYNSSKHGHKRGINFDPALLGCQWGSGRTMACKNAQVLYQSNHLATEGLVIDSETSH